MPLSSIGKIWAYTSEKITEIFGLMVQRLDDVIAGGGLGVGGGGEDSHTKRAGKFASLGRGKDQGFWSHFGCL